MDYNNFKKEANDFEKKNSGLIKSYNTFALTPFNKITKELHNNYNSYIENIKKVSVANFLNTITNKAVDEETEILTIFNEFFSKAYGVDTENESSNNSIQIYFNEVKKIYDKNNNDYNIEYNLENRNKLIEMNLKSVISVAKAFRNLGIPFEDLINAGNLGLCKAFEKYDPERAVAKDKMFELVNKLPDGELNCKELETSLLDLCKYGNVRKKLKKYLDSNKTTNKEKLTIWVKNNVQNARFNSVAVMWIKAYIIDEINQHSRPVKKPKIEIDKELHYNSESSGNPYKDKFIYLDEPIGDNNNSTTADIFWYPDDSVKFEDVEYSKDKIKDTLKILMDGVKARDRRIILQKFGIGYPRELSPKEIAEKEGLSVARVCQIINTVLDNMKKNQEKYKLDPDAIFDALSFL